MLAGVLPLDLAALERSVDEFFSALAGLDSERTLIGTARRLAPWMIAALAGTAAVEFARRHTLPYRHEADLEDSWVRHRWAGSHRQVVPGFEERS